MFVKRLIQLQIHPFRLLLCLEWILLGCALLMFTEFFGFSEMRLFGFEGLNSEDGYLLLSVILIFGVMGLRLPCGSPFTKWLYTGLELGLIGVAGNPLGWNLSRLSPLLVIVVLRSCLIFGQTGRLVVAALMFLAYLVIVTPFMLLLWVFLIAPNPKSISQLNNLGLKVVMTPDGGAQISLSHQQVQAFISGLQKLILQGILENALLFGLVLVFVLLLVNALVAERQGRRKLALAHEQLYQYSLQIEDQATLQERARIAREMHDSLGHLLTAQRIVLENAWLSLSSNVEEVKTYLKDSQRLGAKAVEELRQTITMLRSDPLKGQLLETAIALLVEDFRLITGIRPDCQINLNSSLPTRIQVAVYRIIEEALTNIYKHSDATQVKIQLSIQPEASRPDASELSLQIEDNGKGFNIEENATGFGLRGMQERAVLVAGQLQVLSQPSAGCRICAYFTIPVNYLSN